jgi:hypothetical protein
LPYRFLERYKFHPPICHSLSALKIMLSTEVWISRVLLQISHITPFELCQIRPKTTTEWRFISTNPSSQENSTETGGHNIPINHKNEERPFLSCRIYKEMWQIPFNNDISTALTPGLKIITHWDSGSKWRVIQLWNYYTVYMVYPATNIFIVRLAN